jgi:hypothetical protein
MSQAIETQATLLTQFADGQAAGSITPQDVRNLVVSVPYLAGSLQTAPIAAPVVGGSGAITLDVVANGSVQSIGFAAGYSALTVGIANSALGSNTRVLLELYVTQNSAGNGTLTFTGSISTQYAVTLGGAGVVTRFLLVSLDGGASWSVIS